MMAPHMGTGKCVFSDKVLAGLREIKQNPDVFREVTVKYEFPQVGITVPCRALLHDYVVFCCETVRDGKKDKVKSSVFQKYQCARCGSIAAAKFERGAIEGIVLRSITCTCPFRSPATDWNVGTRKTFENKNAAIGSLVLFINLEYNVIIVKVVSGKIDGSRTNEDKNISRIFLSSCGRAFLCDIQMRACNDNSTKSFELKGLLEAFHDDQEKFDPNLGRRVQANELVHENENATIEGNEPNGVEMEEPVVQLNAEGDYVEMEVGAGQLNHEANGGEMSEVVVDFDEKQEANGSEINTNRVVVDLDEKEKADDVEMDEVVAELDTEARLMQDRRASMLLVRECGICYCECDIGRLFIHMCSCSENDPKKYCWDCLLRIGAARPGHPLRNGDFTKFVLENTQEPMTCAFCRVGASNYIMDERDWPNGNKIMLPIPVAWVGDRACRTMVNYHKIMKIYRPLVSPYVKEYNLLQGLLYLTQDTISDLPPEAFVEGNPGSLRRVALQGNVIVFKKALAFLKQLAYTGNAWLYETIGYPENDIPEWLIHLASEIEAGRSPEVDPNRDIFRGDYHERYRYFYGVKKMMEADQAARKQLHGSLPDEDNVRVVSRAQLGPRQTDVPNYPRYSKYLHSNAEWREFLGDEQYVEMMEARKRRDQREADRRAREATPHPDAPVATGETTSTLPGTIVATGASVSGRASRAFRRAIGMRAENPRTPSNSTARAIVDLASDTSDTDDTTGNNGTAETGNVASAEPGGTVVMTGSGLQRRVYVSHRNSRTVTTNFYVVREPTNGPSAAANGTPRNNTGRGVVDLTEESE